MPNNKKIMKEVDLPELALKVNMKKMGEKAADTGMKGAKTASARTRLINIAKQNKKFKDDKSFQKARDKELKDYRAAVASGIKEGLSEKSQERGNILNKVKKITSKTMKKEAAFKLRSGNKPSIAKFMGVERLEDIKEKLNPGLNKENVKKIEKGIKDYDDKKLKDIVERNLDNYHFRNVVGSPGADSVRAVLNKMGLFDKRK
jgi:hypothetical protein